MLTQLRLQTEIPTAVAQQSDASCPADCSHLQAEAGAANAQDSDTSSCCIGCFRLMPTAPEWPPEGCNDSIYSVEPELLCASCILRLAGKNNKSPAVQAGGGGYGALSSLPKLSLLVKAEAKCQDQLQLLRSQQETLKQQRESLQATKRAKEEALAAERELARQRRKHFLIIQERRKREEELKLHLFQGEDDTSRPEQDVGTDKPKKKKPKPPKVVTPLPRRKSEAATELAASETSLPHIAESMSNSTETSHSRISTTNDNASTAEAHTISLYERRRQMMVCYSQDLSPLIDGRKPRRLPSSKPVGGIVLSTTMKRRQTPDNNAQITAVAITHCNKNQQNVRKQSKSPAPNITKLRPLEKLKRYIKLRPQQHLASNQFEDFQARNEAPSKRVIALPISLQPSRRLFDHSAPLTAEIKPVSWANELAKDVLQPHDSTEEAGSSVFSASLHPAAEAQHFAMFPLQHQLPKPTFAPPKMEPPTETTTKVSRWEYSAERLSSLLEKYNVSVSTVATSTTTAPMH